MHEITKYTISIFSFLLFAEGSKIITGQEFADIIARHYSESNPRTRACCEAVRTHVKTVQYFRGKGVKYTLQ